MKHTIPVLHKGKTIDMSVVQQKHPTTGPDMTAYVEGCDDEGNWFKGRGELDSEGNLISVTRVSPMAREYPRTKQGANNGKQDA